MPDFSVLELFLQKYFPGGVTDHQMGQFRTAFTLYPEWNERINVISRKDLENLAERHFLHSLAIAKVIRFAPGTAVLDAGTGGGFPGIPLAIFFPETRFHLVDSIGKKMRVVEEIARACDLKNVKTFTSRVEQLPHRYDFVVSRAVTRLHEMAGWVKPLISCRGGNSLANGILYLKGGDLDAEIALVKGMKGWPSLFPIQDFFSEAFFESKFVVHLPFCKEG